MSRLIGLMSTALRGLLWTAPAFTLGALLAGCGGGGGMSGSAMPITAQGCSSSSCGTTMITLTDANGDFSSYTVDVTSLTLTKADKTVVETLPVKTRVDFTQLVNVSEFLTAATVPNGEYTAATMTVDYSNAAVFVDINGTPTAATLVDGSGNPLTTLQLTVELDDAHHLIVASGKPAQLALDFNLAASNSVDLSKMPPVVTVKPFIVASVVPLDSKELRVRGKLVSVGSSSYTITVEPFDDEDSDRGTVVVNTTTSTTFEINGMSSSGDAGLTAMKALAPGVMTVAFGSFDANTHEFTAAQVLAGSSLVNPGETRLMGTVIARSGDTLTVRGGHVYPMGGGPELFMPHDVQVTVGGGTMVTRADDPSTAPTIADISVGSAISAFGASGGDTMAPTLDASAGRVRLEFTRIAGTAVSSGTGQLTLNLQSIGELPVSVFNFAGTGSSAATDAKPASYLVATGSQLAVTGVAPGTPLAVIGFVHAFHTAPPDFDAHSTLNFASLSALLVARYGSGGAAFTKLDASGFVLNLAAPPLGAQHFIRIGPVSIDLTTLAAGPRVVPDALGPDAFAISPAAATDTHSMIIAFDTYAAFEAALATNLSGTTHVTSVEAVGAYDQASNTFTARTIAVTLAD